MVPRAILCLLLMSPFARGQDRFDLLTVKPGVVAKTPMEWEPRRQGIQAALERVMGEFPRPAKRLPLDPMVLEEKRLDGNVLRRKVSFQSDAAGRVVAYLFLPETARKNKQQAILCLQQTSTAGAAEPAGVSGKADMHYALHLAQRGYVTLAPDYPGFGESKYDFSPKHGYASGSMKAIWDNVRAVDYLETLPEVDASRIGVLGHSLGGHNALFTAVFEPRLKAIVSSCGFTTFRRDDVPSWNGPRYMPRIKTEFGNDAKKVPFDFPEIVAALAPRPFLAIAAEKDSDFDVIGVREVMSAARNVYELFGASKKLDAYYPQGPHAFPADARQKAYEWLDEVLKR